MTRLQPGVHGSVTVSALPAIVPSEEAARLAIGLTTLYPFTLAFGVFVVIFCP